MKLKTSTILFILLCILGVFMLYYKAKLLRDNFEVTTGRVIKVSAGKKKSITFEMKGEQPFFPTRMRGSYGCGHRNVKRQLHVVREMEFPVVYQKGNRQNAQILLFERQYKGFKLEVPDSLANIVADLSKCH